MDKRSRRRRRAQEIADRAAYLARREQANEEHTRTTVERASDKRFVQRQITESGRLLSFPVEGDAQASLRGVLGRRAQAFRDHFGRDPGPEDPLFFDESRESPAKLTEDGVISALRKPALAERLGLEHAYLLTIAELGYAVSEENKHLFTAHEVDAFQAALERNRLRS